MIFNPLCPGCRILEVMFNVDGTSRRKSSADSHSPSPLYHLACVPFACTRREESGREGSHAVCLHCLRCVLPVKGVSLGAFPAHGAGRSALLPLRLFPCPSAISPRGTTGSLGWGPGRRLGSALAAVRISPLIYTAVSSDRLILQLCLEPAAGPGLWMNQLSLGLGFYFIILLQPLSQAAKEEERRSWQIFCLAHVLPASQLGFETPGGGREGTVLQGLTAVRNKDVRNLLHQ